MTRGASKTVLWNLDLIFPNLNPTKPYEVGPFCICAGNDTRLSSLAPGPSNETALQLLRRYETIFGKPYMPGVLLSKHGAAKRYIRADAVRDFRNACALATIESAVALTITATMSVWQPRYSDHFLFGYHVPAKTGWVGTLHGIIQGLDDEVLKFRGQPSPQISLPDAFKTDVDPVLFSRLMAVWKLQHRDRRADYEIRKLFRALAVGFQAMRYPSDGLTSINDVGLRIATWVSAFEVLFHPGPRADVNKKVVLDAIGTVAWPSAELNAKRYQLRYGGRTFAGNFAQAIYDELYQARNKFLHGEKVTPNDLRLRRSPRRIPLMMLGPLLFGAAVRVVLVQILKRPLTEEEEMNDYFFGLGEVERALIETRTGKPIRSLRRRKRVGS
jgi:hypothetical protein